MEDKYQFTIELEVRDYELDSEGIVNNAVYQHYLEHARHQFLCHVGYSFAKMESEGLMPVVSRVEINYKSSLRSGDVAVCRLWLERKGIRFIFHQDIFNKATGALAVNALVTSVVVKNGWPTRGEKLAEFFKDYL